MKIIKTIKEVFTEVELWLNEPYTFINALVAIGLIALGVTIGYIWFAPY